MTIHDHTTTPPTAYYATGPCLLHPTLGSVPVANLPPGLYPDGGADPVPAGMREVSRARIVRDGKSVSVPTCEPIPLAERRTAAIAVNRQECRNRIVSRWPEDQQRNAGLGVLSEALTIACRDWIAACRAAENAAADLIDVSEEPEAVKVVWP
jgi:hypothetical protein